MKFTKLSRGLCYKSKAVAARGFSTVSDKKWQSVVGLEVHAQLNTESKLFSGAQNTFGGVVNNCVSLFDAATPGTLPVLNRKCVELGIMTALALSCKVNEVSTFDRKHYFYADLPTGYQITQQRNPLASDGVINFQVFTPGVHKKPYKKSSKIKQIQLEQDSGKSLHDAELKRSLIDLNRAGAPLIELVFEPDLELIPTDEACGPCWLRAQRILRRSTNTQNAQFNSGASEDIVVSPHQSPQHEEIEDCCVNCDIQLLSAENRHRLSAESEHFMRVIKLWTYPKYDGEEAAALVKELVLIVQRLGACTGRMEEGALRVDANVSLRRPGDPLATRTEIKNIGSVRGVAGAIRHEIDRQQTILDSGGRIINETRAWDAAARVTIPMRDKEVVQDYRYMPEPNLPPLRVNLTTNIDHKDVLSVPLIQDRIPELPEQSRKRLIEQFQLRPETAIQLVNEPTLLEYFEHLSSETRNPTKVANLLVNDLLTVLNKRKLDADDCPITVKQLKEVTDMLLSKDINLEICRNVLDELIDVSDSDVSPLRIVEDKGWQLTSNEAKLTKLCKDVLDNNPKLVNQYKNGKTKVFKALLGILSKSNNKIDMSVASKIMEGLLKKL